MKKTFKYRLFPSKRQTTILEHTLDVCRWSYNHLLEQRKEVYEADKRSISRYDQQKEFKQLKEDFPFLVDIHSQILQNIAVRIDLAFRAFFRRVKSGDTPGYPRFRSKSRYNSFTYPQSGFKLLKNVVQLSKIGGVKVKLHRPIEGKIKTCTIRSTPTGKWFVTFVCVIEHKPVEQPIEPAIGVDMGLITFATLSNAEKIENPRFFRKEEKRLSKAQRKLSAQAQATKAREKARKVAARIHERINWRRHNFAHQESRKLVNRFNTICVEDLSINDMQKGNFRSINRSIGDAAWRIFLDLLVCKAVEADKRTIKINPAYTSQTCSQCYNRHKLKLSDRIYHCPVCSLSIDRDQNAAINILALGLQRIGSSVEAQQL